MTRAEIVAEAQERFKRCQEWESTARARYADDMRFAEADADNGYQWESETRRRRLLQRKPSLTINKTRQYCNQIINDARQNKTQIRVVPTGDHATYEAAQVYEGIVRHIEYISNAQAAYDAATVSQVKGGIGYWRVCTDYRNNRSNDQEIFIRRIRDPMTVYLDPDIRDEDGSDARYGFVFEDIPRDLFDKKYPEYKDKAPSSALGNDDNEWITKDTIRVAEYYRKSEKKDEILIDKDGNTFLRSVVGDEIADALKAEPFTKTRKVLDPKIDWYLIIGDEIAEKTAWAGKYIPIVRVIGEESVIDGIMDRKGHARALKDPQKMYNFWASAATEQIAMQTKTPWIAPLKAIEGLEAYWKNANTEERAILPYNSTDTNGQPVDKPTRIDPPNLAQAYMSGLEIADQQMQMVSGQYQAMMGEPSNEKSGKAINARQRQGDVANYQYINNLASAIRFTGKILIDLIPKIYDTDRVVHIMAENGDRSEVTIDPQAPQAHQQQGPDEQASVIFNPKIGEYDVESGVGPAYATKREQAFEAFMQIAMAAPEIMQKAGDLMFKAADFPMADEIAERLKPGLPPEVAELQKQLQQQGAALQKATQELARERGIRTSEAQQKDVDIYRAETDRMEAIGAIDPEVLRTMLGPLVHQLIAESMQDNLDASYGAGAATLAPPMPPQPQGPMQ